MQQEGGLALHRVWRRARATRGRVSTPSSLKESTCNKRRVSTPSSLEESTCNKREGWRGPCHIIPWYGSVLGEGRVAYLSGGSLRGLFYSSVLRPLH